MLPRRGLIKIYPVLCRGLCVFINPFRGPYIKTIDFCKDCKKDKNKCDTCFANYIPDSESKKCLPDCSAKLENCQECSDPETCTECSDGYMVSEDKKNCELDCFSKIKHLKFQKFKNSIIEEPRIFLRSGNPPWAAIRSPNNHRNHRNHP